MEAQGRCYCGAVRYKASGDPLLQVQCHCRECQYVSGGSPNVTIGMPEAGFAYTQGKASRIDDECLWRKDGHGLPVEYGATPIFKDGAFTSTDPGSLSRMRS